MRYKVSGEVGLGGDLSMLTTNIVNWFKRRQLLDKEGIRATADGRALLDIVGLTSKPSIGSGTKLLLTG